MAKCVASPGAYAESADLPGINLRMLDEEVDGATDVVQALRGHFTGRFATEEAPEGRHRLIEI